jgi:hypothetical protein
VTPRFKYSAAMFLTKLTIPATKARLLGEWFSRLLAPVPGVFIRRKVIHSGWDGRVAGVDRSPGMVIVAISEKMFAAGATLIVLLMSAINPGYHGPRLISN